jgi:hypothetical protein
VVREVVVDLAATGRRSLADIIKAYLGRASSAAAKTFRSLVRRPFSVLGLRVM